MDHFHKDENRVICDKIAGKFYLSLQEYVAQHPVWCQEDCWCALAVPTLLEQRRFKKRVNHHNHKFKPHKGGSNSIATIRKS
jgi:hypothetical protein